MVPSELKRELHALCLNLPLQRFENLKSALNEAQRAANEETKSTAGDKHDTSRAMMQLEVEKLSVQLKDAEKMVQDVQRINPGLESKKIGTGSLVFTSAGIYYVCVPAGKLTLEGVTYLAISLSSPIGNLLKGKSQKEVISFNGKEIQITSVH